MIALSGAYFGEGSGTVHLNYIRCYGTEYNLIECETANITGLISHFQEVGVICQPGNENTFINNYNHIVTLFFTTYHRVGRLYK